MVAIEELDFDLAAQSFYHGLPAARQQVVQACLRQALPMIESGNRQLAYPIEVAGEKVYVLKADEFLRLIVRKAGDTVRLLDIIDKRQATSYLSQAA